MKKIFTVVMAVAFAFSVVGFAVAAEKAAAPAAAPAAAKAAPAAEKAPAADKKAEKKAAKPKSQQVTGTIEALDAAAGTFTVKGKKGNVDLKAGEKVKLGDFKVGDKVQVKYSDGTATAVRKGQKAKKAEPKADAKPAVEKKAAPAAAPAPAKPAEKK